MGPRRSLGDRQLPRLTKAASAALPSGFRSTILEGLTAPEIKAVLAAARQERIFPRQILQQQGDPVTRLWLLVTGRAAAYKIAREGRKLFLRWGVPGDAFGLATIVREPAQYVITVEAVQEGSLLAWDLPAWRALVLQCPSLSESAHSVLAGYLDGLMDTLVASLQTAEQRLARMLVVSARQIGRAGREGIEIDLTNEQLAVMANVTVFTASRKSREWQDLGILKKQRGKIVLRSLSLFETIAKDTWR